MSRRVTITLALPLCFSAVQAEPVIDPVQQIQRAKDAAAQSVRDAAPAEPRSAGETLREEVKQEVVPAQEQANKLKGAVKAQERAAREALKEKTKQELAPVKESARQTKALKKAAKTTGRQAQEALKQQKKQAQDALDLLKPGR